LSLVKWLLFVKVQTSIVFICSKLGDDNENLLLLVSLMILFKHGLIREDHQYNENES